MTGDAAARIGAAVHDRFTALSGSGGIATGYALEGMARWALRRRPRRILEVGAGIGTTTAALVAALDRAGVPTEGSARRVHVAVERVPYCRERMAENLGPDRDKVTVVDWPSEAPAGPYDLVVVDGLGPGEADGDLTRQRLDAETAHAVSDLGPRAVVIVENVRTAQRRVIEATARPGWVRAHLQPWDATPGYHLYLFDPTPVERVGLVLRAAANRVWFPAGRRVANGLSRRVRGRRLSRRTRVASGPDYRR